MKANYTPDQLPLSDVYDIQKDIKRKKLKSEIVPVRFTKNEKEWLSKQAEESAISVSSFIRHSALDLEMPPKIPPQVNRNTYNQLCRLGNNLNQVVKGLHQGFVHKVDPALLKELIDTVNKVGVQLLPNN